MNSELNTAVTQALSAMRRTLANGPDELDAELIRIWVSVVELAGLTPAEVRAAAGEILLTERFFPQPAVFIEKVRPKANQDAAVEAAWLRVVGCVSRYGSYASLKAEDLAGDRAALWALDRMGWIRLCETLEDENRAILRAEFVRFYAVARQEKAGLDYLAGRCEIENTARTPRPGPLTPEQCGRPDRSELPAAPRPFPVRQQALPAAAGTGHARENALAAMDAHTPGLRRMFEPGGDR
jgi:hypothetical protein